MSEGPLTIAQVNTRQSRGGAEAVALQLHRGYRRRGHAAWLLVGRERPSAEGVFPFPSGWRAEAEHLLAGAGRLLDRHRGLESFRYPKTRRMLDALPAVPEIVHLHNLHGGYFDLRVLPELSQRTRLVMTLHDAWLLSGHCAHSFDCGRWRTGCGACPDLSIYPAVRTDATAANWRRKQAIFAATRLHVATPSRWLAARVGQSMLAPAIAELRVIPNGVDRSIFRAGQRTAARARLGIASAARVVAIAGAANADNPFKDRGTALAAVRRAAASLDGDVLGLLLGERGGERVDGSARIRPVAYVDDPAGVASCLQAADVYVHAARADTFPNSVIEAMACGTAVIATAVGGIREQLDASGEWRAGDAIDPAAAGIAVPAGDASTMAVALATLLADAPLRERLARNAERRVAERYDLEQQCDAYLGWYDALR
jgi:glycosyltransferase involved in cell wall biosynthesis